MDQKIRILVADANELTRAVLGEIFVPEYDVAEVGDSDTLLDLMRNAADEYAALLLGMLPTEQQAVELLKQLNAAGLLCNIPVFLMLQDDADTKAAEGMAAGALDIIEKPFNPAVVRRRVANGIELYSRRLHSDLLQKVSNLLSGASAVPDVPSHPNDRTLHLLELERHKYQMLSELSRDITFTYDCIRQEAVFSERYREIFGGEIRQKGTFASIVAGHLLPEDADALRKRWSALLPEKILSSKPKSGCGLWTVQSNGLSFTSEASLMRTIRISVPPVWVS